MLVSAKTFKNQGYFFNDKGLASHDIFKGSYKLGKSSSQNFCNCTGTNLFI